MTSNTLKENVGTCEYVGPITSYLLVQDCKSQVFASNDNKLVITAINFHVATICGKCSGGVSHGERFQIAHPSAHLNAEQIVEKISPAVHAGYQPKTRQP